MDKSVKIFHTPYELAERFAEELIAMINLAVAGKKLFSVALSGGSTPELLLSLLGDYYSKSVPWEFVHFFWGDERCVPPDDVQSNYGMTKQKLLDKIMIPPANIHRIQGEADPYTEISRYSDEISHYTARRDGMPRFNLIMLGLGEDGHTASIFPGRIDLFNSENICEVTVYPGSGQKRITITGRVINNADAVAFLVTGGKKAEIVKNIIKNNPAAINFPAYYVVPVHGSLTWYIDEDGGSLL